MKTTQGSGKSMSTGRYYAMSRQMGVLTHEEGKIRESCLITSMRMDTPRCQELVGVTGCLPVGTSPCSCLGGYFPVSLCLQVSCGLSSASSKSLPSGSLLDSIPILRCFVCSPRPCLQNILSAFLASLLAHVFKMSVLVDSFLAGRNSSFHPQSLQYSA